MRAAARGVNSRRIAVVGRGCPLLTAAFKQPPTFASAERLNDRRIAALLVPTLEQRQRDYWDETLRGFGVQNCMTGQRRTCRAKRRRSS